MVSPEDPEPNRMSDTDLPDVPHADGRAALRRHHNVFDIAERLHQADAAHHQSVVPFGNVTATRVRIVAGHGVEDLLESEVECAELCGVDRDLVLLDAPAPGCDVR